MDEVEQTATFRNLSDMAEVREIHEQHRDLTPLRGQHKIRFLQIASIDAGFVEPTNFPCEMFGDPFPSLEVAPVGQSKKTENACVSKRFADKAALPHQAEFAQFERRNWL